MKQILKPIGIAGGTLDRDRHVCAFFHTRDDEYGVLLPFIGEGIQRGEKAFHIVDPRLRADHLQRLQTSGIKTEVCERTGQLEVRRWDEAYLRNGRFDQNAMLALIEEVLQTSKTDGFPLTRLAAHMEWALEDFPGVEDLVEYETRLNYILPNYKDPVI